MDLFVDVCVRSDSKTKRLADCLLSAIGSPFTELRPANCVFPTIDEKDEEFLLKRDRRSRGKDPA